MQKKFVLRTDILICLLLVITTSAAYIQVRECDFVNFDDDEYVTENAPVKAGMTWDSIRWAFAAGHAHNWHPLTWLSLMLGCQIYGLDPGWHHLTNVGLHIINTLLLFMLFRRLTGQVWQCAFVAALFALHPLHVESVAWVTERKDVLSMFFWMLTVWSYLRYTEQPGIGRYLATVLLFVLGLMAKPMLVTLPFILLLLDFWPLGRIRSLRTKSDANNTHCVPVLYLIREKVPFIFCAIASSVVTLLVQQSGGAVKSLEMVPLSIRIANGLVSYSGYIKKMLWPFDLAVLYPHPGMPPWWHIAGALMVFISITILVSRGVRKRPWLAVGWLWYVGALVPVIGLVQAGVQAMADRFTYVPLIGLSIMIAWGLPEAMVKWRFRKPVLSIAASAVLAVCIFTTYRQVHYWTSSITLFKRAISVTTGNYVAHTMLGAALAAQGKTAEAIEYYRKSLHIKPDYVGAHNNLGNALVVQGRPAEAIDHFLTALQINPGYAEAHYNLALALSQLGRHAEAITHYREAVRLKPTYAAAHNNLGVCLFHEGKQAEAIRHYREALHLEPDNAKAHTNLGNALAAQGKTDEALMQYNTALQIAPDDVDIHINLGLLYFRTGKQAEALTHYRTALRLAPQNVQVHINLGVCLFHGGKQAEALTHYHTALRLAPENAQAHVNLGNVMLRTKKITEAVNHYRTALKHDPENAEAHYNLGLALLFQGDRVGADTHLQEAVRIRPDYSGDYAELKERIGNDD